MALVDYSDSDGSETEQTPVSVPIPNSSKSTFQKVVDRSNPGKIRVSLPRAGYQDVTNGDGPSAKRVRIGGGGLAGFNSFLPPPKCTGPATAGTIGAVKTAKATSLAPGVSLKTRAAPGISRELELPYEEKGSYTEGRESTGGRREAGGCSSLPSPKTADEEVKMMAKPLMFKPLSVSRKPVKKKYPTDATGPVTADLIKSPMPARVETQPQRQNIPLFSLSSELSASTPESVSNEQYEPMIFGARVEEQYEEMTPDGQVGADYEDYTQALRITTSTPVAPEIGAQSLSDIASDLQLSAAEKRQLFGRQKRSQNGDAQSATKIINFNTDEEYTHNEQLRAAGEQAVHNPVRAIAPGKHSLQQLVNAAVNQKEALEESFAKAKNNRAEASSRYGW